VEAFIRRLKRTPLTVAAVALLATLLMALAGGPAPVKGDIPSTGKAMPQGMGPTTIAVTDDGEYAYIGFHLSDTIFKVRLEDLTVEAVADLSQYFPLQSYHIALDAGEKKLFVHSRSWQKLLVLDTQTMSVIHTIEGMTAWGMTRSQYGPFLITWDGGNTARFVNTESYEVTEFTDNPIGFLQIQESKQRQGEWYVVSQGGPGGPWIVGLYDYEAKAWNHAVTIPLQGETPGIPDLKVLPNERKAYAAVFGGKYADYHAYGWLLSIDLVGWEVKVLPIDGGAQTLEVSPDSRWVYVGTHMPLLGNNILVIDTRSDAITGQINLGKTKYGWHYGEIRNLHLDLANPRFLYATSNDANAFVKADLDSLALADVLVFNEEEFQPHLFVKRPTGATGYILIRQSAKALALDLGKATVEGVVEFPMIRADAYSYDVVT